MTEVDAIAGNFSPNWPKAWNNKIKYFIFYAIKNARLTSMQVNNNGICAITWRCPCVTFNFSAIFIQMLSASKQVIRWSSKFSRKISKLPCSSNAAQANTSMQVAFEKTSILYLLTPTSRPLLSLSTFSGCLPASSDWPLMSSSRAKTCTWKANRVSLTFFKYQIKNLTCFVKEPEGDKGSWRAVGGRAT